jgi:hypothetical protein
MKRAISDSKLLAVLVLLVVVTAGATYANPIQTAETAPAAETDPKALLEKVAETYRKLKRYEFDFTLLTDIRSAAGRKSVETRIELMNVRPDKLRMLISGGLGEVQVYSDGAVSSMFCPGLETVHSQGDERRQGRCARWSRRFAAIAMQVLEQFERISSGVRTAKVLRTEKLEVGDSQVECLVVEVELEEQDPTKRRLRTYWIDPQRNLVLKAVQFDKLSGEGTNAWRRRLRRRSGRPRAIRPFRTAPLPSSLLRTRRR